MNIKPKTMQQVALEDRLETYRKTKLNCQADEFPNWVKAIDEAVEGDDNRLKQMPGWVTEVFNVVRTNKNISFSDSIR